MAEKILLIGATDIGRRACAALQDLNVEVLHLASPQDSELHELLAQNITGVAIMLHNDIEALRYSLTIEHIRPGIRLFVAIFDRSVRHEMERTLPNCSIASPAYIAGSSIIAAAILSQDAIKRTGPAANLSWEILDIQGEEVSKKSFKIPSKWKLQRFSALFRGQFRSYDLASRAMLTGLFALLAMLLTDAVILQRHMSVFQAFYSSSAIIAGVTAPEMPQESWQFLQSGTFMLLTIIFIAMFGAGVVNHILNGRRVGIVGRRVIPRKNHVVIVGLGQVGIRLCKELTLLKIPVVAIEQDEHARGVLLARDLNVPVIIGNASDVRTLKRACVGTSKALLAMASVEQDNIAVAVAARTKFPDALILMRAGTNDAIEETRSLFSIGEVADVNGLTAAYVAQALLETEPKVIVPKGNSLALIDQEYGLRQFKTPGRCTCSA
ncbi:MAG: NAD-binding protein [Actinobacteria bacterium]|nr:NAD-binding protein [Actinomycetota bacterium]